MSRRKKKSLANRIAGDLLTIGFEFRINDLNEVLEVQYQGGEWKEYDTVTEAKLKLAMRNIGYGGKHKPGLTALSEAVLVMGDRNRYNPIQDYFKSLAGKYEPKPNGPYLIPTLATYFQNPDGMFQTWLFKWMVGAIAKVYEGERNPMLVMVGEQDKGKSWFTRWLCPLEGHHLESGIHNPDDKDNKVLVAETLVWEVAELESTISRAEVGALKAFITNKFIKVRPPYGRRPIQKQIPASFIGTVNYNGAGFLNDPSGSTRFLACEIPEINWNYTEMNVDDLWAEALWFYRNVPNCWKLDDREKAKRNEINEKFEIVTGLEIAVEEYFTITKEAEDFIHTSRIKDVLVINGYRIGNENAFPSNLGRVLTKYGLKSSRRRVNGKNLRGWIGLKE